MNIIKLSHREDFGHDWYVQVLFTKHWALFQSSVSWNDYPSWPYLQIKTGNGSVLSIIFWAYKFGFDIGILERTWNWGIHLGFSDDNNYLRMDECLNDFLSESSLK
jgi:hypothetical protein